MICNRQDKFTISTETCVNSILRALGNFLETEVNISTRIVVCYLFPSLWYISPKALLNVSLKLGKSLISSEMMENLKDRERKVIE